MLDLINRYAHGFVAVPVLLACAESGLFALLQEQGPLTDQQLAFRLHANAGHLQVALRMMHALNWLSRHENENQEGAYTLTAQAALHHKIPADLLALYRLPMSAYLRGDAPAGVLGRWIEHSRRRWDLSDGLMADFLDGVLVVPLLLALQQQKQAHDQTSAQTLSLEHVAPVVRDEIASLFVSKGWANQANQANHELVLSDIGHFLLSRALITGVTASYRPMLAQMPQLLFGDVQQIFSRDEEEHEKHLDRTLNVVASGFQHEKYFADVEDILISIFNRPLSEQPTYVADMGCGDGTLLKRVYEVIRDKTARGDLLEEHPLYLIGIDYNQKSLIATAHTLAQLPHFVMAGDIGQPGELLSAFAARDIDPATVLHIRSFLDHDRPFIAPEDRIALQARANLAYGGVYVDELGGSIAPHVSMQSLVEHLSRWASITSQHGLIILEVHSLAPEVVHAYLDHSENLHFDALQAFSSQHLVEADLFLLAAAEAGLFPKPGFAKQYPKTLPFSRITLNCFDKRPVTVRHPQPIDLDALLKLEAACWGEGLRASPSEIQHRIEQFPEQHFVLQLDGRIVGVIYSQRITDVEHLTQATYADLPLLRDSQGRVIQLLAVNVLPEVQHLGFGDQLLEFMLQWLTLKADVSQVVGVTRCKSYQQHAHLPLASYIQLQNEHGQQVDPILRFHQAHGAMIQGILHHYRPADVDNQGAGILIEYDLRRRHERKSTTSASNSRFKALSAQSTEVQSSSTIVEDSIRAVMGSKRMAAYAPERPLMEMKLDSLDLLELRLLLNQRFASELDPTFFFRYGTPQAIAGYFDGQTQPRSNEKKTLTRSNDPSTVPELVEGGSGHRFSGSGPETTKLGSESGVVTTSQERQDEPIAIIGMACRFPGDVETPEAYWALLRDGVDAISQVPNSRWDREHYREQINSPYGGFLSQVDQFDAPFFRMTPVEARATDPQQRLLLEVTWEALERAGLNPQALAESQTGVFVGIFANDYQILQLKQNDKPSPYFGTGTSSSVAAGRLSYFFGFQGPAISLDTACSSSLVALHLACQSLRSRECHLALASGVNLLLSPELSITFSQAGMLAADGRCKTFDASANGYVRSEGCGVVVLKRLSEAIADQDRILAVVRGSAINQDGTSNGLTAPNGFAQEAVIRRALSNAGVEAHQISYVEAHGTGTSLGDPVEVTALEAVYGQNRTTNNPLVIGSVKTNIGHTEGAAGMAGLLKVILSMQNSYIPPHLHLEAVNPLISLERIPAIIPADGMRWSTARRLAGVSSFGFSGTNAHVILEEAPSVTEQTTQKTEVERASDYILTLSAKSEPTLRQLAQRYAQINHLSLADLSFTANTGRADFAHRLALVAKSPAELQEQLSAFVAGEQAVGLVRGQLSHTQAPKIAFLFTGQGSQYVEMGRELYDTQPVFRQTIDRCAELLRPLLEKSLLDVLYPPNHDSPINQTAYTQPALFALEYALVQLWKSWGIEPDVVMGHSVGEYVAACVAGVFSLEDGLKLIAERGRLMQSLPQDGDMVAILASEATVAPFLAPYANKVSFAAINGPNSVVISGERNAVRRVVARIPAHIRTIKLSVSHAFHSPLMEPILAEFEQVAKQVSFSPPQIHIISNVTTQLATDHLLTAKYWTDHITQPVRFAASMLTLEQMGYDTFVEIGPASTLLGMARRCLPANASNKQWLPTIRPNQEGSQLLSTLSELYVRGWQVDWAGFYAHNVNQYRKVILPTYIWQKERYWLESSGQSVKFKNKNNINKSKEKQHELHPYLGARLRLPFSQEIRFEAEFSPHSPSFMHDHRLYQTLVVPAASHISMVLSAVKEAFNTDACMLEDLFFPQALILSEEEAKTVQLVLSRQADNLYAFQLIGLKEGADAGEVNSWDKHALGKIKLTGLPRGEAWQEVKNIEAIQRESEDLLSRDDFYEMIWDVGYTLGESFRWNGTIWRQDDDALTQIEPPVGINSSAYQLHPGLIDSCLQMLANFWPYETEELVNSQQIYLPFLIDQVKFYAAPSSNRQLWCHAHLQEGDHEQHKGLRGDIRLFDDAGRMIAEIIGFEFRRATRQALEVSPKEAPEEARIADWFYQVTWQAQARDVNLPNRYDLAKKEGSWLIFADQHGVGERLADLLMTRDELSVLLQAGTEYSWLGENRYQLNPANPTHFEWLLQDVGQCKGVLHLWSLNSPSSEYTTLDSLQKSQLEGSITLLHLIQSFGRLRNTFVQQDDAPIPPLWLLTQGTQPIHNRPLAVAQAPLWGLARVITREHPDVQCVCVDLSSGSDTELQLLFEELSGAQNSPQEEQIAYDEHRRYVARLTSAKSDVNVGQALVNANDSYLITGGLGALGLAVADWLAKQGAQQLVLTGRSGVSTPTQQETIKELEEMGVKVLVVAADVANQAQVASLLAEIEANMPPLGGIIHAAGVLDDGLLLRQDQERMARVMAPKIEGTWNLHTLTQEMPLDFFVCFSSIASLIGSPGQSNYAAANAFMDAICHHRRALGLPALAINWGAWAGGGMAERAPEQWKQLVASWGIDFFSRAEGLQALEQALRLFGTLRAPQNAAQVGVLAINWATFMQQFTANNEPTFYANVAPVRREHQSDHQRASDTTATLRRELEEVYPEARAKLLNKYIQNQVAQIIGARQLPNLQQGFFDIGMDSLMAVELRSQLESTLGTSLPSTLTFKYPTIAALSDYLVESLFKDKEEAPPQEEPLDEERVNEIPIEEKTYDFASTVAQLEQMSDAEVEALLLQELARF